MLEETFREEIAYSWQKKKNSTKQKKPKSSKALFRTYVKQVKRLAEEIGINKKMLEETFREEMKSPP